ncbi:DUF190 domain-containing protein [Anaeromyxobacter paludicola]|uniref:CBS domain-containing protein n=1 Tax=Anaeromyxobacter paludicola TaxID=2918171 RepID=A0ABM7XBB8_9BACT|nr:DUF190 domain-containing protein [Anaeromyxobacter paludicola]BDG09149.1 hypothetical protein AMPC_22620 [Anaeromyxobacter paludicola]
MDAVTAKRVRIYLGEDDRVGREPAHLALVEWLQREGARGASAFRAVEGFGGGGELHVSHLVDVARRLPILVEWVDDPRVVDRLLTRACALVPRALVTVETVEVAQGPLRLRPLPHRLTAADVMTREVASVPPGAPLREVVELALRAPWRGVPVVEEGRPVGMITGGDLVTRGGLPVRLDLLPALDTPELSRLLERLGGEGRTAADVMSRPAVAVGADMPLPWVAEVMAHRKLKRVPVVDREGRLAGVVTRLDLLRSVAGGFSAGEVPAREAWVEAGAPIRALVRHDVPVLPPDAPLPEVLRAVLSTPVGRAIVAGAGGRALGVVSDAALLDRVTPSFRALALQSLTRRAPPASLEPAELAGEQHALARTASELMGDAAQVREDGTLAEAVSLSLEGGHDLLCVTDGEGRLVGALDRADLLRGLVGAGPREGR